MKASEILILCIFSHQTLIFWTIQQKDNVLYARLLVIPKQTGCSDTCTTTNEEEIWTVTDREDVIFLGWVGEEFLAQLFPKNDMS